MSNSTTTKGFRAPNARMTTPSHLLANASQIKPSKRTNWSFQKRNTAEVRFAKEKEAVKESLHNYVEGLKARRKVDHSRPSKFLVIKRVSANKKHKGGYQIIGHGIPLFGGKASKPRIVSTMDEVREFARKEGRTRIKLGAKEMIVG